MRPHAHTNKPRPMQGMIWIKPILASRISSTKKGTSSERSRNAANLRVYISQAMSCISLTGFRLLSHVFSSVYQDIPLYTLDEFHERAPESLRDESTASDHALMLARLNYELQERQRYVILRNRVNYPRQRNV